MKCDTGSRVRTEKEQSKLGAIENAVMTAKSDPEGEKNAEET